MAVTTSNTAHSENTGHTQLREIPGNAGLPILGWSVQMLRNPQKFLNERYTSFGEISWSKAFGIKVYHLLGPDANQFVMMNQGNLLSSHGGWDYFIGKFFTRGIMLLDFDEHRHHRRIMQSAFTTEALNHYLTTMNPGISHDLRTWKPGNRFLILPAIKQLTLNLATQVFMGQEVGHEADTLNKAFIDCVRAGTGFIRADIPGSRWHKGLVGRKVLEDYFYSQIAAKRQGQGSDMFSQLCHAKTEDGASFSDEDVVNHMIFLMMAAHDTTTITLSNMIYYLAKYPEWQEQLRSDCQALGKPSVDYEDLDGLEKITLVMKESLRLCAPVPSLPRKSIRECEFKGYRIPKGSMVTCSMSFTHHMESLWPDAEKFDPLRFSKAHREDKITPYAWVPFGGGAHKCIGLHFAELQVKAVLHQMLLKFRWSVADDYVMPLDTTSLPVPADKLPVQLMALESLG